MYRLFTFNSPLNYVLYAVIIIAMQVGWWVRPAMVQSVSKHTEPLSSWLFSAIEKLAFANQLLEVAGVVVVFFICVIVNQIVVETKIIQQRNYVAGAMFSVLISLMNGFAVLSPQLIAFFLTVRVVQKLFSVYGQEKPSGAIFDLGWLSAIAMLFYFPSFWLLIFIVIGITVLRPFSLREWWMIFIGFFSPLFMIFTWYFWFDKAMQLPADLLNMPNAGSGGFQFSNQEFTALIMIAIILFTSLTALPRILFSTVIQVRKFTAVLLLSVLFCALSYFMQTNASAIHLITLVLPLSIFSAMFLQSLKSIFIPELIFGLLILCVVTIQFFIS